MKKFVKSMVCVGMAALFTASFAACAGDDQKPGDGGDKPPVTVDKNPSVVGDAHGYYFAAAPGDLAFNMYMSGGTFESLKVGDTTLTRNQEYKFNIGTEVLTINESYLATLATGDYTFTFSTDQGSCEILVTVGGSDLIEGYNMEFAIPETNDMADHFFAKGARDDEAVTFDFRTFGNFTTEGTSLKFINLLVDNAPFDDTGLNWRLGPEDVNVRLYSDGTVIYRKNFTGTEIKNGVANGLDNIWWKTNWNNPNYQTGEVEDVTVTREGGVTSFSLELSYEFLGIENTDDFRFALMECSDASSYDFNLYERGIVELNGTALGDPAQLSAWPMFTAENKILRPEEIPVEGVPEGYDLSFAMGRDQFYSKMAYAEGTGVTFDFWTRGDFNRDGEALEFVQIYLDMPEFNLDQTGNWQFRNEDLAIRVYSDGSVYFLTDFNGETDNVWCKLDHENLSVNKPDTVVTKAEKPVTINRQDGVTTFSLTVTLEQLGIDSGASPESFLFYLAECSDNNPNDFNLYASDLAYKGTAAGDPARFENYLLFTLATDEVSFPGETPDDNVPEGYDLSFGNSVYGKFSLAQSDGGVTFDFWTKGDFSGTDEFVNIYLDMPAYNQNGKNWCFETEDVNLRVYADGTVYLRTEFDSTKADNVWYPRTELTDSNKLAQKANIVKDEENGTTTVSVTVSFEQLGTTKDAFEGFRFWLAECVDNTGSFDYNGAGFTVRGTKAGTDARLNSWPMFTAEGEVLLADEIPVEGLPEGYDLAFAMGHDQIYSRMSYAEGTGVTFDFWTKGSFDKDNDALEFVQIYLDMPDFNIPYSGNWKFNAEDVVIRIYSDGSVYFLTNFNGTADNVWVKLDHDALTVNKPDTVVTKADPITIDRQDGVTTFSLTVTLEQLGIGTGETLDSFRFYIAECSDNSGSDFALYASDLSYKGTAAGDPARFENYLLFTLATGEISADANEAQQ